MYPVTYHLQEKPRTWTDTLVLLKKQKSDVRFHGLDRAGSGQGQVAVTCDCVNRLTPNDPYMGRAAPLTSKRCILYIYSTNIGTEYFKHALYSPFIFLFKMQFVS